MGDTTVMTTLVRTDTALPLEGPPGFPVEKYVARMREPHMATSREFRHEVCRMNPIMFGLHYLRRRMTLKGARPVHALSEFHVELAESARRWAVPNLREAEVRDAWVQPRKSGKALALDTPILTANRGWVTHGELIVGDRVFDETGTPCNITHLSPRWSDRPCYRLTFSDGEQIVADANHEWFVHDRSRERSLLRTTEEMAGDWSLSRSGRRESRYSIPNCKPLQYPDAELPIAPYVLGVWLGDGDSNGGRITVGLADADNLVAELAKEGESPNLTAPPSNTALSIQLSKPRPYLCPREHVLVPPRPGAIGRYAPCKVCIADHQHRLYGGPELAVPTNEPLIKRLRRAGLLQDKHIPEVYFSASADQRLALFQGLMDTDGSITTARGECSYAGTNERLCRDVLRLALTLGIKARIREGRAAIAGIDKGPVWRMTFRTALPVFRLPRKRMLIRPVGAAGKRHVTNIERVENRMTSCISVDSPSHLYLAGRSLIPTHNTSWIFLVLPLWAMAYRHREYIAMYSDTEDLVCRHLATLRQELRDNDRLRRDFPLLCEPMRDGRKALRDNASSYLAANGTMIEARGMNSATLGVKWRDLRPDTILLDEIEPQESKWSADQATKRLRDLREGIFEINDEAVVQITGTTVMHGSIIHQVTEGADWVAAENIAVHHTTGIIVDPVTGEERSCWPQRWSLEALREKRRRNPRNYAKNYDNAPVGEDGTHWRQERFVYDPLTRWIDDRILVVDPTGKSGKKNDETGIGKLAYARSTQQVVVEDVVGVRMEPDQLRARIHSTCALHGIRMVIVDTTNGGDWIVSALRRGAPAGLRIEPVHISRGKPDRFAELLDWYLCSPPRVVHARPISTLESLMCSYPHVLHDDQIDVVSLGCQYFIDGLAKVGK